MTPRVLEKYKTEICPALMKEFGYKNVMQLPRLQKIVVNIGVGDAKQDIKFMDAAIAELRAITGQQPLMKRAKKSVAGFKVREGMPVACTVTLRGTRMWEFLAAGLTGAGTTIWACASSLFSRRSATTRSSAPAG
jgi:large subunit ribosomal protein L5